MKRLMLCAAATLLASGGFWTHPAAAQEPTPPTIGATASPLGVVTINDDKLSIGWLGAPGVVVTPDHNVRQIGQAATFVRDGSSVAVNCYVAKRSERLGLAALRCEQTAGATIPIASGHPAVGTAATASFLLSPRVGTLQFLAGQLVRNDVDFMGQTRLQFSFNVLPERRGATLHAENVAGTPVMDPAGQVISTLIVAPAVGGPPLGSTPGELRRLVADTAPLPQSFPTAAIVAIARRAAIPSAIGVALGIVWGLLSRNNTLVVKALGLAVVGALSAVAYSLFTMLVIGPETLLG